jgi:hypothetical protein
MSGTEPPRAPVGCVRRREVRREAVRRARKPAGMGKMLMRA